MLSLTITLNPEGWDEEKQEFVPPEEFTLRLEHSLLSLAKWESKWKRPFISDGPQTWEETVDYIKDMTLTHNVPSRVYDRITNDDIRKVNAYIEDPMTATVFWGESGGASREVITAEIIYFWMTTFNIPVEFQKWHLNRLITLAKVCSIRSQPPKKMSREQILSRNAALNAARRKKLHTKG